MSTVAAPRFRSLAAAYIALFVNRRAYVRQMHKEVNGKYPYYRPKNRATKEFLPLTAEDVVQHLMGAITLGFYASNPVTQCAKWIAIDADYGEARRDLLRLKEAFAQDSITALLEQSRRGGHLWVFLTEPIPARLCRKYVVNVARRLGVPVKAGVVDGIEVFPRQDELAKGDLGSAIRGPFGIHRASGQRYWFEDAAPTLDAQVTLLRGVRKVTRAELETLTAEMPELLAPVSVRPISLPAFRGDGSRFEILKYVKPNRKSGKEYVARCPACALRGEDRKSTHLNINIKDPNLYKCWGGCTKEEIRRALGAPAPASRFGSLV